MNDIITLGEVLIDLTQTGVNEKGVRIFEANPGGAPANVAVAASLLGAKASFIGKVGADAFGQDLVNTLREKGVDTAFVYTDTSELTTMAVVSVDEDGDRSFRFYRNPGADTQLTEAEVLASLQQAPKILHLGSLSLTHEPARSATMAAIQYVREHGGLVSYDPNYRASLWPDEKTAVEWMRRPLSLADIVKLSDEELPLLTGSDDPEIGTRLLMEEGAALVLVTLGGDGAFYRLGEETGVIPGEQVRVADTNGAGDTFVGALLSRLTARPEGPLTDLTTEELEEYIFFANHAAALTCSRSGAIPAMPTLAEVTA